MAQLSTQVDVGHLDTEMTIHVRILRRFRVRVWLALQMIRLAAWLFPMNVRVEVYEE